MNMRRVCLAGKYTHTHTQVLVFQRSASPFNCLHTGFVPHEAHRGGLPFSVNHSAFLWGFGVTFSVLNAVSVYQLTKLILILCLGMKSSVKAMISLSKGDLPNFPFLCTFWWQIEGSSGKYSKELWQVCSLKELYTSRQLKVLTKHLI